MRGAEQLLQQGGFPALPGSGHGHRGKLRHQLLQEGFDLSMNVAHREASVAGISYEIK